VLALRPPDPAAPPFAASPGLDETVPVQAAARRTVRLTPKNARDRSVHGRIIGLEDYMSRNPVRAAACVIRSAAIGKGVASALDDTGRERACELGGGDLAAAGCVLAQPAAVSLARRRRVSGLSTWAAS